MMKDKELTAGATSRLQRARLRWRQGDLEGAREQYRSLISDSPECTEALVELGNLEREQSKNPESERLLRQAVAIDPGPVTHTSLGRTLVEQGKTKEGIQAFLDALGCDERYVPAYNQLGELLGALGQVDRARSCFEQACEIDPDDPYVHHNLGVTYQLMGALDKALAQFRRVVELQADYWRVWRQLGEIHELKGQLSQAVYCYERLATLRPLDPDNHVRYGAALQLSGDTMAARAAYERALELQPGDMDAAYNIGTCYQTMGELDRAESIFRQVLSGSPDHVFACAGLAGVMDRRGDYREGLDLLRPLVASDRANIEVWVSFARLSLHAGEHSDALQPLERALETAALSHKDKSRLHFMLGDLHDAAANFDRAFTHYRHANELAPRDYDQHAFEKSIDDLIEVADDRLLKRLGAVGRADPRPVFVVGMPRTGSTLLEQVLTAHRSVESVGESTILTRIVTDLQNADGPGSAYPQCLNGCTLDSLQAAADQYLASLPAGDSEIRVVDKMLSNFLHLGLIQILFPRAHIIHCMRHPLDTALSCYFNDFSGRHIAFAYDFCDIAHSYRNYRRLMQHWEATIQLPMLSLHYEDLVKDPQTAVGRVLDFLELPWDPACLRFHQSGRVPNTASYAQVRKPIHTGSVKRYKRYAAHLAPLLEALGELAAESPAAVTPQ